MDPKKIREALRERAHPCPSCGALLMVRVDGGARTSEAMDAIARDGGRVTLEPIEEAEAAIREELQEIPGHAGLGGRVRR